MLAMHEHACVTASDKTDGTNAAASEGVLSPEAAQQDILSTLWLGGAASSLLCAVLLMIASYLTTQQHREACQNKAYACMHCTAL